MSLTRSPGIEPATLDGSAPASAEAAGRAAPTVTPPPPPVPAPYRSRRRGWPRWAPAVATVFGVLTVIGITLWQLHLNLLLTNTSTTGGDTGAHYILPAYIRSVLLPHGQLTGWDPAWYDGFPLYTYYFVLPDLWAALTSFVIPYNIAFKWATVLGSITMPIAAYACGKLLRLRPPIPAVLAVATLPFLFDYTWTIYGGNLFSTLAGEYAFSLGVTLALVFIGLFGRGIRNGRHRGWAAVTLALCFAAHLLPTMFALAGAVVLTAFELVPERFRLHDDGFRPFRSVALAPGRDGVRSAKSSLWWAGTTVGLGFLLSGWWLVPFGLEQAYSTSMGYSNVTTFETLLLPHADWWVLWIAAGAALLALATLSRFGLLLTILCGLSAAVLAVDPQGKLYNTRFLPFWFLCVYLLAGWGVAVVVAAAARNLRRLRLRRWVQQVRAGVARPRPRPARWAPGAVAGPLLAVLGACLVVVPPFLINDGVLPQALWPVHAQDTQVSDWAAFNYVGYEGQPAYPELKAIISTMRRVGAKYGCGRAMWEYNPNLDRFGTPMALMDLPYWTNGCIDSMEGLLFESSATTPYHFLNQSELSVSPSDPMVGLPYGGLNVAFGTQHLQLLGVRYFMASSPETQQEANADPALHLVAQVGPIATSYDGVPFHSKWDVYEVADSAMVTPLHDQPVVLQGVKQSQSGWLPQSENWYLNPADWKVERTAGGPVSWARRPAGGRPPVTPVPSTTVSHIVVGDQSLSFHVSRVGTPVLVKVSYFPNWVATGAQGPWRADPNLMVVVPTSHEVTLNYRATSANNLGDLLTLAGVLCLAVPATLRLRRRIRNRRLSPSP